MIDLMTKPHSLVLNYGTLKPILAVIGPAELQAKRAAAFARFESVGLPTTRDEEFKYTSLRAIEETEFKPAYGATVMRAELEMTPVGKVDGITLTFVNGEYAPELSSEQILPEGVVISSIEEALATNAELILPHLGTIGSLEGKLGTTNDERFTALNTAYLRDGAFVLVPKNLTLELPIHLQFVNKADHGTFASHPRVLILLDENSEAKILESYVGLGGTYFTNAVTEVALGKGARLEHTKFQGEGRESYHIAGWYVHQAADSVYTSNNASFGGQISRTDLNVWLDGEHTETWLNGAYVGTGSQVVDNHTRIDHAKPNCNSFEVYKGILGDKAQGVFNGKIFVYEDAQKTDAKQTNQAILLSPTASVNTKPQLEIFADDVKCTHGATVGQLRDDALFYLRARGIPYKEARAILVYAFAAEVLEKVTIPAAREALEKILFDRLNESEALPEA